MKKKKLQLKDLKVKSFITILGKEEQRTAKGGYVNHPKVSVISKEVKFVNEQNPSWTSEKTRATGSDDVLRNLD